MGLESISFRCLDYRLIDYTVLLYSSQVAEVTRFFDAVSFRFAVVSYEVVNSSYVA
jgi:hypothetical protein